MERRGYGEEYINRYKMMTRFHHQRVPLVILVCGTACAGKSTIATQLAQRLNLPNVLQTDMVYELLRTSTDAPLASTPVWNRDFNSSEEFITEFCRECRIVRKGLAGDLKKATKDGKPIIIEGIHLDPSIYLMDEENRDRDKLNNEKETSDLRKDNVTAQTEEASETSTMVEKLQSVMLNNDERRSKSECSRSCSEIKTLEGSDQAPGLAGPDDFTLPGVGKRSIQNQGNDYKSSKSQINVSKKEKTADPIIVPIVLKMAEFDHKALLEEWISTKTFGDKYLGQDQKRLISNLKTIQDYLCSFEAQGLAVVNISATTFPQTLDWLHSYLLQCIERGVSDFSNPRKNSKGV